jgi:hypothetical protein
MGHQVLFSLVPQITTVGSCPRYGQNSEVPTVCFESMSFFLARARVDRGFQEQVVAPHEGSVTIPSLLHTFMLVLRFRAWFLFSEQLC